MESKKINIIEGFLSEDECKELINSHKNGELLNSLYVADKITKTLNDNFKFKGFKFGELGPIIFKEYTPNTKYTLKWIINDFNYFTIRIQLNDEYDNGYHQYLMNEDEKYFQSPKITGSMIFFFSNVKHRLAPVESKVKYVLETELNLTEIPNFKKTLL